MNTAKRDFVALAIADYEGMTAEEQGKMVLQLLEDQPIIMGFITNLADDFSDEEHETLVECLVILINAFVSAGVPVDMVSHEVVDEVIHEKIDQYEKEEKPEEKAKELSDSPMVFEDLRNHAMFKSALAAEESERRQNFGMVLDTIISMIERSIADQLNEVNKDE